MPAARGRSATAAPPTTWWRWTSSPAAASGCGSDGAEGRRRVRRRCGPCARWSRATLGPSGPSSAASAGRSPATAWSTCCRRTGFDVPRFLAGTEGTLAVIVGATVRLVADAPDKVHARAGLPDHGRGRPTPRPSSLRHGPTAVEGLDRRIVEVVRRTRGAGRRPAAAAGRRLDVRRARRRRPGRRTASGRCAAGRRRGPSTASSSTDPVQALALWKIREDGAGLAGVSLDQPGVPRLGGRCGAAGAAGRATCATSTHCWPSTGFDGLPYGHFGDGCVHLRIDFPLTRPGGAATYRASSSRPPRWSPATAARCRASTATAGPVRPCSRRCTPPPRSACSAQVKDVFDPDEPAQPGGAGRPAAGGRRPARRRR